MQSKSDTAAVLEAALALLGPNGERWIKGWLTADGDCHCVIGAILYTEPRAANRIDAIDCLEQVIGSERLDLWNDDPARTWPEVQAAFERAIQQAKGARE